MKNVMSFTKSDVQKRIANDPKYKEKGRIYNNEFFRSMKKNAFLAKELLEKEQN